MIINNPLWLRRKIIKPIEPGETPVLVASPNVGYTTATSELVANGVSIVIPKDGTYRIYWTASPSWSSTMYTQLYVNGNAAGTQRSISDSGTATRFSEDLELVVGDIVAIYTRGVTYGLGAGGLVACIDLAQTLPDVINIGDTLILISTTGINAKYSLTSSLTATGISITIPKAGAYRFKWSMSSSGNNQTVYSRLYRNGAAIGTQRSVNTISLNEFSEDIECGTGDVIALYARGTGSSSWSYGAMTGGLAAFADWDNGF